MKEILEEPKNYIKFSLNLFYVKNENIRTIYNNKKIRLGSFTQDFNEKDIWDASNSN